jgi:hypothetical protein
MNNFVIGTIRENISLLFNNLHVINDSIPKKLDHLSDLAGRWTVNDTGDIIPLNPGAVGIGTLDNPIKECFVSIIKGPAELVIDPYPVDDVAGTVRIKGNLIVDGTGGGGGGGGGNADTATKISSITNSNIVQLAETQTLTNKTLTSPTISGTGGSIDGAVIGANSAAAASFTTITASTNVTARDVNAVTIGNIVPVELTVSGGRASTKTISANATAPLNADILAYYSGKTFAAGQCVVALTDGTNASVAMFSFSKCGASTLTLVLDQEVHSSVAALSVDYDSSGTIDLILGTATSATYCVKVLPVMTSDSIAGPF